MTAGVLGTAVGLLGALLGIALQARANRRQGAAHPVQEALGRGPARSPLGIERAAAAKGARIAFPSYALFVVAVTLDTGNYQLAGILGGGAGFIYGLSAAVSGTRLAR